MNAAVAAGGGPPAGQAGRPAQGITQSPIFTIVRMMMFWYFLSNMFGKKVPRDPSMLMSNSFAKGEPLDMWVYVSDNPTFSDFSDESSLAWYEGSIPYATYDAAATRAFEYTYHPSEAAYNNGSVYAHIFFARAGFSPDPQDPTYDRGATFHKIHPLVMYRPRPKFKDLKNLLGSSVNENENEKDGAREMLQQEEEKQEEKELKVEGKGKGEGEEDEELALPWISYWKPNVTIYLVDDFSQYPRGKIPPMVIQHMTFDVYSGNYFPTVQASDFWLLKDKLIPLNSSLSTLPLSFSLSTIGIWKWQLLLSLEQSFQMQRESFGAAEGESEEFKRIFLEGNPILLCVTMVVSLLHTVFDMLAFKNDIQFWNQNKSMEGLSARSIVINCVCQIIIFFYLLDNETSWLIIFSSGLSCAIEFWKIGKAMHVDIDRSGTIPMLRFRDRDSYSQNKTKEYDEIATRYLSYALYPLVGGYAVYSLLYQSHKSWYSWVLTSLTGCVYTFGFIMMCPQLFINYKLKSVAHMPWRQMTYKFLNTIIDDLFAFVIKMPLLHRLSVFRDDIIFLIYLYQRWVYPVDKKRVNEFGYGGADTAAAAAGSPPPAVEGPPPGSQEGAADGAAEGAVAEVTVAKPAVSGSGESKVGVSEDSMKKRRGGEKEGEDKGKESQEGAAQGEPKGEEKGRKKGKSKKEL